MMGAFLAVVDLDTTKVRNNLIVSTFRKWAFEVTEPHIYEYYQTNMSSLMAQAGLEKIKKSSQRPYKLRMDGKEINNHLKASRKSTIICYY